MLFDFFSDPGITRLQSAQPVAAKQHREREGLSARGNTMRIVPSVRSLVFAFVVLSISAAAFGQVGIAIRIGPPAIPVYEQPICPGDGYLWTPGYWAYDYDINDYYWVPGT
jgi:hypothetical protein